MRHDVSNGEVRRTFLSARIRGTFTMLALSALVLGACTDRTPSETAEAADPISPVEEACVGVAEGSELPPKCADQELLAAVKVGDYPGLTSLSDEDVVRHSRSVCALGDELERSGTESSYQDVIESLEASWKVDTDVVEQVIAVSAVRCQEQALFFGTLPLSGGSSSVTVTVTGAGPARVRYVIPELGEGTEDDAAAEAAGLIQEVSAPWEDTVHLTRAQDLLVRVVAEAGSEAGCTITAGDEVLAEEKPSELPVSCEVPASKISQIETPTVERD